MTEKSIDASIIRTAMHKAVDQLIDTFEGLPKSALTGAADDEEIVFIKAVHTFREQPWFQETAADYEPDTVHYRLTALGQRNEQWARINEETKESALASQKEWNEKHAGVEEQKWNSLRPRELPIVDLRTRPGYHLLDENGGSLQELFRENLY